MIKQRFISMLVLLCLTVSGAWAGTLWTGGTYTAEANENRGAITVNDDATLTINEGVTVTVNNGLTIAEGKTLTVTGPGTLVVTGAKGNDGPDGGPGGNGGVAISGNIIVQGGAVVTATGGYGGDGGFNGGTGGNGGVAISGNIIVQGGATVTATGGTGGTGGNALDNGGNGGNGGNAFAGTLTYKSGTVTANGGSGGSGGSSDSDPAPSGSAGKAFANDVDFTQTTVEYTLTDGSNTITTISDQKTVVIAEVVPATVAVTGVTLAPTSATLIVGETTTLTPTVAPDDATDKSVTWSSSNTSVATVSNEGVVTAVAAGEATITVTTTDGAFTATCTVTVAEPTYTVSLKEGTDDAEKWQGKAGSGEYQSLPLTGLEAGTAVTVKYNGRKRVTGVKAVKKGGALATPLTMEALTDGTIVVNLQNIGGARRYDYFEDIAGSRRYVSPGSSKRVPVGGGSSNISVKYSVNGGEKTTIYVTTETTTIPVNAGDKVQFYGDATSTQFHGDEPKVTLQGTAKTKVYGNIMSLIDEDNYATLTTLPNESFANFGGLFYLNENLTDASGLLLPATTLTAGCYYGMFAGCTSLTTAPALPATELAELCYFMMFFGCTSLNSVTCLATDISASDCTSGWLEGVATTGTFTKASGATWPEGANGIPSGWTVNEQ